MVERDEERLRTQMRTDAQESAALAFELGQSVDQRLSYSQHARKRLSQTAMRGSLAKPSPNPSSPSSATPASSHVSVPLSLLEQMAGQLDRLSKQVSAIEARAEMQQQAGAPSAEGESAGSVDGVDVARV